MDEKEAWKYEHKPITIITELLYPQYEKNFKSIKESVWKYIQKRAAFLLSEEHGVDEVREHWKSIINGIVPFGLKIRKDRQ